MRHSLISFSFAATLVPFCLAAPAHQSATLSNSAVLVLEPERSPLPTLISGCTGREILAELSPSDPAYDDALRLQDTLDSAGLFVRCTMGSKKQRFFKGQRGAAFYRTDAGSFDVLFLPKTKTFAGLKIVERRENGRYLYSFRGAPHSAVRMDSPVPLFWIRRKNVLFYVWGDPRLAATLRAKLSS